jgi:energy-converting hydrogenase Eha subunit A
VTGLGTGVGTALAVNVGTAGAPVINGGALGSPSSAGTLPAFTLGGTISGGGNQINNVVIGSSTPLAGNFTTLNLSNPITTSWTVDSTVPTTTLASGASAAIATGSGYLWMYNANTGAFANFSVGGGNVNLISSAGGEFAVTSTPSASQTGVFWSGSAYTIKNGMASSGAYHVCGIRFSAVN